MIDNLKIGDVIDFFHPLNHSFQTQRIYKIKKDKIILKNVNGEFIKINKKDVHKIREEIRK